jgi:hypothetical protein
MQKKKVGSKGKAELKESQRKKIDSKEQKKSSC